MKALAEVVAKDGGTREGYLAQYYLGTLKAQNDDAKGAESDLRAVANSGSDSAALAKIALAQLYIASKRTREAQDLLRSLVNKPTDLVSKVAGADSARPDPMRPRIRQKPRKILQQLKTPRKSPAVTRAADQVCESTDQVSFYPCWAICASVLRVCAGADFPNYPIPYRNDFQRDRDRIIHSRAFRRLEGKTQVFSIGSDDHTRNRLTHTIEVSQVARTVAVALGLNDEYTETLALAHDLGHPPFGHVGEKELDRQMRVFGGSFEHNLHALRIVDLLEERYPRFSGLNLTFEVREGIVKHSPEIGPEAESSLQEFLPGQRPALEAQLLDIADEIAYTSADLDDSFAASLISFDDLRDSVPLAEELIDKIETQYPGASPRVRFWEVQRQLMNLLIGGLIEGTVQAADRFRVETIADVRALDHRIAKLSPSRQSSTHS